MDENYSEKISKLNDEVEELRKLGREMQMSEEEIKICAIQSLDEDLELTILWHKVKERVQMVVTFITPYLMWVGNYIKKRALNFDKRWHRMLMAVVIAVGLLVFSFLYYAVYQDEGPLGKLLNPIFAPLDHSVLRILRLMVLPLHSMFNIGMYHNAPCVVVNPYYTEPVPENCWNCNFINKTRIYYVSNRTLPRVLLTKPLKFANYTTDITTLKNITDLVQNDFETLNHPSIVLQSTVPWLKQPVDLLKIDNLEERIMAEKNFHVDWISRRIATSQVLRKLFSRPNFLTKKSEILITRRLIIDGPGAKSTILNNALEGANILYIVHTGNRTLEFVGKSECESKCTKFQTVVEAGEMVYLPTIWDFRVLDNGDELNIASVAYVDVR